MAAEQALNAGAATLAPDPNGAAVEGEEAIAPKFRRYGLFTLNGSAVRIRSQRSCACI